MQQVKVIKKTFFTFSIVLGAVGSLGFSILSITCTLYIVIPSSPGNKYMKKLPVVLLYISSIAVTSCLILYGANRNLIELNSIDED